MELTDLPLWANIALLTAAGAATWAAGTHLTRSVDAVASATGTNRTFLGAVLLGGITSLPEAATMTTAAAVGGGSFAVGNVLGSASANLAILAGCDALVGGVAIADQADRGRVQRQGILLVVLLAIVACAGVVGAPIHLEVDLWTVAIAVAALGAFFVIRAGGGADTDPVSPPDEQASDGGRHLRRLIATGAVIVVAGYTAANAGSAIAEQTGLSGGFVGFALLAVSTSLPELSTTVSALGMGRANLAFGNILGTNIFNHLLLLPADLVDGRGPLFASPDTSVVAGSVLGIVLVLVYLIGVNRPSRVVAGRLGVESIVVLALYVGGTGFLYTVS